MDRKELNQLLIRLAGSDSEGSMEVAYDRADRVYSRIIAMQEEAVARAFNDGRIDGMGQAKLRVLRRTQIPEGAKNPTRDATVYLGEAIADIIQNDIDLIQSTLENK